MQRIRPDNERILDSATKREALLSAVGLWKDRTDLPDADLPDAETYVRSLRKGERLKRISK
jgi:hypothetical protein